MCCCVFCHSKRSSCTRWFQSADFSYLKSWGNLMLWSEILSSSFVFFDKHLSNSLLWEGSLTHLIQCAASHWNISLSVFQVSYAGEASRPYRFCCTNMSVTRPFAVPSHCSCFLGSHHFTLWSLQHPPLLHWEIQCYPHSLRSELCHKVHFPSSLF